MNALVIYNKKAGGGKAAKYYDKIKELFVINKINADIKYTEYFQHAIELVSEVDLSNYDSIISVGGDGTFYECLNGYYKNKKKSIVSFGILPIGTGNSLSRDIFDKDYKLEEYIELISKKKTKAIDIAKYKSKGVEMYYANTLGFGIVSDIALTATKFKFLGNFAYTIGVLYRSIFLSTYNMKLIVDGKSFDMDNVFVSISNSRYTGGNFHIAPDAKVDDGYLDLIIVNRISRINLLKTFPKLFTGKHVNTKYVETMKAKKISVETSKEKIISPDGELYGNTPLIVECIEGAINIITD